MVVRHQNRLSKMVKAISFQNTSLKNRFEELQIFKSVFRFLLSSTTLKSLNDTELEACCGEFAKTFSSQDSSDVEVNDLLSELKVLKLSLHERPMSSVEIFLVCSANGFVSKYFNCLLDIIYCACDCG
jgi:hypothetical protein